MGELLPGSASDRISSRIKACHAHTVLTIPLMFGNWECHHKELGKNGVTAGQGSSCWLCSPDLQPDPPQHPSVSQLLLVLSTGAANRPDQRKTNCQLALKYPPLITKWHLLCVCKDPRCKGSTLPPFWLLSPG